MGAEIPEGDFEKGKKVFKQRCAQCHEITSTGTKTGPTLNGVVGRKSGQVSGFDYSAANKNKVGFSCRLNEMSNLSPTVRV
jgi:cytochrome c